MAATTEAVLSVAELRRELRIGIEDTNPETAALVEAQRDSAVSAVSKYLAAPLVDTTETLRPSRPDDATAPLVLIAAGAALVSLRYWSPSGALRLDPDGAIPLAELGRTQRGAFPLHGLAAGRRLAGRARRLSASSSRSAAGSIRYPARAAAGMRARCAGVLRRAPDGDESGGHVLPDRAVATDRCTPAAGPLAR